MQTADSLRYTHDELDMIAREVLAYINRLSGEFSYTKEQTLQAQVSYYGFIRELQDRGKVKRYEFRPIATNPATHNGHIAEF